MEKERLVGIIIFLFLIVIFLGYSCQICVGETENTVTFERSSSIILSPMIILSSEKHEYKMGEEIAVFVEMKNIGKATINLNEESKKYDFFIRIHKEKKLTYKRIYPVYSAFSEAPITLEPGQHVVRIAEFVFSTNDINSFGKFSLSANVNALHVKTTDLHFEIIEDNE